MTHVPIIPPYEPATGITQSPERPHQRRPVMGRMSDEEAWKAEWACPPSCLQIVKLYWETHSVQDIASIIRSVTGFRTAIGRLVYALKRRLDRGQG